MARRMPVRWQVAHLMNRLPGQCWTGLVSFALGWRDSPWQPVTRACRGGSETGTCYCGKLRDGTTDGGE
jgi:hypothetical protein